MDEKNTVKGKVKVALRPHYYRANAIYNLLKWRGVNRIFCISFQRTGTTSVGKFLSELGYPVAGWPVSKRNDWDLSIYEGNHKVVFSSLDFLCHQAFEDGPWFAPELYKILYHKFPRSKFILLERDPDDWFESMLSHSKRKSPGKTEIHAKTYNRDEEYFSEIANGKAMPLNNGFYLDGHGDHYKRLYVQRNMEVRHFFNKKNKGRLFYASLYDPRKWDDLAEFLGVKNSIGDIHENKTVRW